MGGIVLGSAQHAGQGGRIIIGLFPFAANKRLFAANGEIEQLAWHNSATYLPVGKAMLLLSGQATQQQPTIATLVTTDDLTLL